VDALDQQIDLAVLTEGADIILLDLVQVEHGQLSRRLRRRTQDLPLGRTSVEALQASRMNGLADGLAATAAKGPAGAGDIGVDPNRIGGRQTTMKAPRCRRGRPGATSR
jgi:hypothetical protein